MTRLRANRPSSNRHRRPSNRVDRGRRLASLVLALGSAGMAVAGLVAATIQPANAADAGVGLGTAGSFAVLAGSTVTNTGPSMISGSVGLSPGSAITGFPPGVVVNGSLHAASAVAATATNDLTTAYNDAAGRPADADVTDQDLGGLTLTSGVYEASSSLGLTGTLTLDAQGRADAVFIFKAGSTLITASNSTVRFINGGSACNVFWQVGSSATLGTSTRFIGTILALTSASLGTNASVQGRVLARNGAVTLDTNTITAPNCAGGSATDLPTGTATETSTTSPSSTDGASSTPDSEDTGTSGTVTTTPEGPGTSTPSTPANSKGGPTPSTTPTTPVIPKKHPDTGLGGTQASSATALFVVAGLCGAAAACTGALSLRRRDPS